MKKLILISALTAISLTVAGCASKAPSFGESIQAEGKAVAGIGTQWEKGQAMIKKGNRMVRKGNNQISEGKENVADGNALIKSGEQLVADAERKYGQVQAGE